jgi:hypothetical protein
MALSQNLLYWFIDYFDRHIIAGITVHKSLTSDGTERADARLFAATLGVSERAIATLATYERIRVHEKVPSACRNLNGPLHRLREDERISSTHRVASN